ncbi:MAG: glycoside hydrolase family 71/99-like protein [Isosphaeraceae bacterium]
MPFATCPIAIVASLLPAAAQDVDFTTIDRKVMVGYQGWFRCPGDTAAIGWRHWSRNPSKIDPKTITVEMWPDLSEYADDEKFPAPGFTHPDGSPASLFSSTHPSTVERHFRWMQEAGIDGAYLQRFLVEIDAKSIDTVLENVRQAASKAGRAYAIEYDLSGCREDQIVDRIARDWNRLAEEKRITQDPNYLHHNGKPVVFVWGFFPDRFPASIAHKVIDVFKSGGPLEATLIGGVPWTWRAERGDEWARALRRFDVISPWNVGHYADKKGVRSADTSTWESDRAEAARHGMGFLPVIYPGFGWTNLKGPQSSKATIPRRNGDFFREQFAEARRMGLATAFVAMFDEVDEGTAIFKVSNTPPTQARFQNYEGLPPDTYLKIAGEAARAFRGR